MSFQVGPSLTLSSSIYQTDSLYRPFLFLQGHPHLSLEISPGRQRLLRDAFLYIIMFVTMQCLAKTGYPWRFWTLLIVVAYAGWYVLLFDRYLSSTPV
jgi:hypothetical protein